MQLLKHVHVANAMQRAEDFVLERDLVASATGIGDGVGNDIGDVSPMLSAMMSATRLAIVESAMVSDCSALLLSASILLSLVRLRTLACTCKFTTSAYNVFRRSNIDLLHRNTRAL